MNPEFKNTKAAAKVVGQIGQYVALYKLNKGKSPKEAYLSKKQAQDLGAKDGDKGPSGVTIRVL